jgi:ubiquinone/menaquinone biosynthesis C-methylase UbiE
MPRMIEEHIRVLEFYETRSYNAPDQLYKEEARVIEQWLESGACVLDAGCGWGRMFPLVLARGCVLVGLDLSLGVLKGAKTRFPSVPLERGDLTSLPFKDKSFDVVMSLYGPICHVVMAEAAAGEMRRVARERLLISVYNYILYLGGVGFRRMGVRCNPFTPLSAKSFFSHYGKIRDIKGIMPLTSNFAGRSALAALKSWFSRLLFVVLDIDQSLIKQANVPEARVHT